MADPVLETVMDWGRRGLDFALVTVIGVRGSTYRGLGARQVMAVDGTSVGTVSGGCLDVALQSEAATVIESNEAHTVKFDLTADDDEIWGWGIGCNGVTEVLIEPMESAVTLADLIERHEHRLGVLVHVLGAEPERNVTHHDDGSLDGALGEVLDDRRHRRLSLDDADYFLEVIGAAPSLVVCGAGHDAVPLVEYASKTGFDVVVVDDRSNFLDHERFPSAKALVNAKPSEVAAAVELGPGTAVVIMSHNYLRDLDYLAAVIGTDVEYVGVLGPGERLGRLLNDLEDRGVSVDPGRVHGPAGLDIGADGPHQIAVAVLAEVLTVRNELEGGFLRNRKGVPLASRTTEKGSKE